MNDCSNYLENGWMAEHFVVNLLFLTQLTAQSLLSAFRVNENMRAVNEELWEVQQNQHMIKVDLSCNSEKVFKPFITFQVTVNYLWESNSLLKKELRLLASIHIPIPIGIPGIKLCGLPAIFARLNESCFDGLGCSRQDNPNYWHATLY